MAVAAATNHSRTGKVSSSPAAPHNNWWRPPLAQNGTRQLCFTWNRTRRAKSLKNPLTARWSLCMVDCSTANALHLRRNRLLSVSEVTSWASSAHYTVSECNSPCQMRDQNPTGSDHTPMLSHLPLSTAMDWTVLDCSLRLPIPPWHAGGQVACQPESGLNRFERKLASAVLINVSILEEASARPAFKMGWL